MTNLIPSGEDFFVSADLPLLLGDLIKIVYILIDITEHNARILQPGLKRAYKTLKQPEGETADKSMAWMFQVWNFLVHVGLAAEQTATLLVSRPLIIYRIISSCCHLQS